MEDATQKAIRILNEARPQAAAKIASLMETAEGKTKVQAAVFVLLTTDRNFATYGLERKREREKLNTDRSLRFKVLQRDDFTCHYCGRKPPEVKLHVDHVIPIFSGGKTTEDNLVAACEDCNLGKRTKKI